MCRESSRGPDWPWPGFAAILAGATLAMGCAAGAPPGVLEAVVPLPSPVFTVSAEVELIRDLLRGVGCEA